MSEINWLLTGTVVALLMVCFFASIEVAFTGTNRLSIELKKKQGKKSGIILSYFMDNPARFISFSFIGFDIFLVLYGSLFVQVMNSSLWTVPFFHNVKNEYLQLILNTVLSALILLVFSEFIPRSFFRAKGDAVLIFFAPLIQFFYQLFHQLATLFIKMSQGILLYIFNIRIRDEEAFSKIELDYFLQQTGEADEAGTELNTELFEKALSLSSVKIRQCLVPRTEVEALELNASVEEAIQKFIETHLSRIVVYENNIDNVVGYIHQLDLFKKPNSLRAVLLPILAVPESMSATDLIAKFSKERKSIAWVVDEFGGTAGIITMEDLLEEIFGDIKDEYDTDEFVEQQLSENEYIFSGRLEIDYLNEKYNLNFPENDSETLSGYIINHYQSIPPLKERIIIDNYEFDILNVSETRIEMVKMKVLI